MESIPKKPLLFGLFVSKPHKIWAVSAVVFVLIGVALDSLLVVVLKNLTDSIASPDINFQHVWIWTIAWPILYMIADSSWRSSGFTGGRWFMGLRKTAFQELFEYISLHSKEYFNNRFSGALVNKISNAVDGSEYLFERILWKFMPTTFSVLWFTFIAGLNDVRLGAIIFVWASIFITINILFAKKLQPYSLSFADSQSVLKGRIVDSLSNISLIHEHAYLPQEKRYIGGFINKQFKAGVKHWWVGEWMLFANQVMIFAFLALMVIFSVYLFQTQLITVGTVVMVINIGSALSFQLFFLGQELKDAARYYAQIKEGLEEILLPHFIKNSVGAKELVVSKGQISFEKIDFEYENAKVFNSFSLSIPAAQRVGLVGKSGAGKTTFVALLLRHFETQKGAIKIDNQSIQNVTLDSLRKSISFVPQDTTLFHRTILENISYGSPNALKKDVVTAAKLAQAHNFITKLPKRYDTLVGERGVKLSGGQRQRIAIARAFLKNSPILVLDEATSSLDSESEHAIQISLDKLLRNKTVIAIAHRLSTLKKMDRIVVIDNGTIVEQGNPTDLLKKKDGVFKNMWEHQVKGFIL
jgi:ATP-binding cassette, subfamily B, bacterial